MIESAPARRAPAPVTAALVAALSAVLTGCGERIPSEYGTRHGSSVNGTAVLAEMFDEAGHSVTLW